MMDEENGERTERRAYARDYSHTYTRETMRGNRRRGQPTKKESVPHVMAVQVIVCLLSLLVVFALHITKSPVDKTVRQALSNALSSKLNQKELAVRVSQAMKRIQIGMPDVKGVFNTSSKTAKTTSTSSSTSSAGSEKTSVATTSKEGEGGADLVAQTINGVLIPPSSVSLGPYLLSAQPIWPVQGRITSKFGFRINPVTHKTSFHTGMDIASPKDTPIVAALPGVVEQAGQSVDYGNFLLLDHGGGIETFYGHCDQLLVGQGTPVKIGDTIAKVGTTGMSTGYHLHFEIHVDHICVNPARALGVQI